MKIASLFLAFSAGMVASCAIAEPTGGSLRPDHPRMFFNAETWPAVKARAEGPARAERDALVARCRAYTDNPVCTGTERVKFGRVKTATGTIEITPATPIPPIGEFGTEAAECALAWRFTGEKAFLEKAQKMLLANGRGYREAYANGRAVNWWSTTRILSLCAYDWIFEALSPDERRAIIVPLVEHVEEVQPRPGEPFIVRRNSSGIDTGFYGVESLLWYSGLAAAGDGFCDALAAKHLAAGGKFGRDLLDFRSAAAGDDGELPSGVTIYALGAYPWSQFNFMHTYLSAYGENLAPKYPGLALLPNWIWWTWINRSDDGSNPAQDGFGDDDHNFNALPTASLYQHLLQQMFFYHGDNPRAARLAAGLAALLKDPKVNHRAMMGSWPMYPFILDQQPPDVKPYTLDELRAAPAKARYFERLGQFKLRSGWMSDSTYATFTAGAKVWSHKHYDENSFTIFKRDFLAIDSGTRAIETDYSLRHYYAQTVAHNCVLINKPGEPFVAHWGPAYGGPEGKTNDGGQRGWCAAKVLGYETNGDFTYIASDAAACYGEKCREALRQFVHVQSDVFVVYDRVSVTNATYGKRWLLHTVNEPIVEGARMRADCGKGRLFCETLLPAKAKIGTIGGPGKEFWSNGKNWEIDSAYAERIGRRAKEKGFGPYFGAWRVEVSPTAPAETDRFLHVLTATETSVAKGATAQLLADGSRDGVRITLPDGREVTVWFNRIGKAGGEIEIDGKSRAFATGVQKQSGISKIEQQAHDNKGRLQACDGMIKPTRFKPIALKGLAPRPDFWKVRPKEIIELCERVKKPSRREVICHTPLGHPVYALFYGDFNEPPPQSNWSAGSSSRTYRSYFGDRRDGRQTVLFVAGIHGAEPECVAGAVNLIEMLEVGKDFRGRTDAELLDLIARYRFIVVPCVNMDGRALSPDHLRGIGWHDFRVASQGTWKDGSLVGWRGSKDYFPLPLDRVSYPGGYPNADGFNIMHDATPGNIRTAEAKALLRLCERWRVDAVLNGHSYELAPSVLAPCYGPKSLTDRALDVQLLCNRAIKAAGLTDWKFDRGTPTETHNLNALFTMASGALALTLECSVSWPGRADDPSKAPAPYSFDELMEPVSIVLKTILAEGLKNPFVVRMPPEGSHLTCLDFRLQSGGRGTIDLDDASVIPVR